MKPDGSFTQEGMFTAAAADGSYTVTDFKHIDQIDAQRSVIILGNEIPPVKEILTFAGGGAPNVSAVPQELQRAYVNRILHSL